MMTNQKIRQQEAAVEMIRMQVGSGRARPDKLEAAINELNRLKSDAVADAPTASQAPPRTRTTPLAKRILADVNGDAISMRQASLSEEATRLRKEQSELSNMLHKVPPGQSCSEITNRILDLHHQIENVWDQKKYLQRNEHDGPLKPSHDQKPEARSLGSVQTKAELTVTIQKQREKVAKLKKKISDPKASEASKTKWAIELATAQSVIEESVTVRALI